MAATESLAATLYDQVCIMSIGKPGASSKWIIFLVLQEVGCLYSRVAEKGYLLGNWASDSAGSRKLKT
jgi:hypothetical protein